MKLAVLFVLFAAATTAASARNDNSLDGANGPRTIVRETVYYGGYARAATPTPAPPRANPSPVSTPPANIATFLGQLRPLYNSLVHYPAQFIIQSVFRTFSRLALLLLAHLLFPLLRLLIVSPFILVTRPFLAAYRSTIARFIFAGLTVGTIGGAIAAYASRFGIRILVERGTNTSEVKEVRNQGARFERIQDKGRINGDTHWNPYGSGFAGLADTSVGEEEEVIDQAEDERPIKITSLFSRGADMVGEAYASARQGGGTSPRKRWMAERR